MGRSPAAGGTVAGRKLPLASEADGRAGRRRVGGCAGGTGWPGARVGGRKRGPPWGAGQGQDRGRGRPEPPASHPCVLAGVGGPGRDRRRWPRRGEGAAARRGAGSSAAARGSGAPGAGARGAGPGGGRRQKALVPLRRGVGARGEGTSGSGVEGGCAGHGEKEGARRGCGGRGATGAPGPAGETRRAPAEGPGPSVLPRLARGAAGLPRVCLGWEFGAPGGLEVVAVALGVPGGGAGHPGPRGRDSPLPTLSSSHPLQPSWPGAAAELGLREALSRAWAAGAPGRGSEFGVEHARV